MKKKFLNVYMNGISVGRLEKNVQGGMFFKYAQTWLDIPEPRPISLSLPLVERPFVGDVVYNFFDNLLPDNIQIRRRIQAKFNVPTNHPFDLLASIGKDCVGAIQVINDDFSGFTKSIKCQALKPNEIASVLRGYRNNPLGMSDDFKEFRISIAGAQEKTAFLMHKGKWNIPLGQTPTSHIFKLPIGIIEHQQMDLSDSCENEWLCSKIAKAFGFKIPDSSIEYFDDIKVLVVERFDRKMSEDKTWIMRLPQEDMCQALGISSNLKYQSDGGPGIKEIMSFLLRAQEPVIDREIFFRAQILFWLLCAIDGHAKNFSVFIEPKGRFQLAPLYDIMSAYPLIASKQLFERKVKMAMALKGKNTHYHWRHVKRSHFNTTAQKAGFSFTRAEEILDEMLSQVDEVIEKVGGDLPKDFPEYIFSSIFGGMRLMREHLFKRE